jgi:hypothetical protein
LLSLELINAGCKVFHAENDADYLIATKAIESARRSETVLIGDDTDLLVLLLYHFELDTHNIIFLPQQRGSKSKIWSICDIKRKLDPTVTRNLLFLHAILGCDTTSRLHGICKGSSLKKILTNKDLVEAAMVFDRENALPTEIAAAGEKALLVMYSAKSGNSLNSLRYQKFIDKTSSRLVQIDPSTLPPTFSASKFHSYRVFLQICDWKKENNLMRPEEWGWKLEASEYVPICMDIPPAPQDLLQIIRCNCQADCSSRSCTCRKHDMKCSVACGQCRGTACTNASTVELDSDDILEEGVGEGDE